jgi:hypothetical protein
MMKIEPTIKASETRIPSYLATPSKSKVKPPVITRAQTLPFGELSWEDFERLCARLVRLEAAIEHCQLYGVKGDKQEGIDIYARKEVAEKYWVYQCKRENDFGPAKIKAAISKFLSGDWATKTEKFTLCTKESLTPKKRADELEAQSKAMRKMNIELVPWDCTQLSEKLKEHPRIVDDFFGREWAKKFCGEDQARNLGNRLDAQMVMEFRERFGRFYKHVFNTQDPGLPVPRWNSPETLPLEKRYVLPDVHDRQSIRLPVAKESAKAPLSKNELLNEQSYSEALEDIHKNVGPHRAEAVYQRRQTVENWLVSANCSIIFGGPGSGKSSLLRFLAIDLLNNSPQLNLLSHKWGQQLPVWVPFPFWTQEISGKVNPTISLSEVLHSWLKSWDEERLWPLIENALEDDRLLLLVDGLDEYSDESAARIALDRLCVFIGQRNVPAIVVSRPHGFERLGMQLTGWQRRELSDFSSDQQKQLCSYWFNCQLRSLCQDSTQDGDLVERKASAEVESFFSELQSSGDLRDLAKVPLLLCLLIYHRLHNVRLPQNRFKAYESIIEHLICTHPTRRRKAALLTSGSSELLSDDLKALFATLAYHAQKNSGEGLMSCEQAQEVVEEMLKNSDSGFGFDHREARRYSKEFLDIGESTIGILVKKSPQAIGFFHRALQEYLAAFALSRMSLGEQKSVVKSRCANPQWREVILGLFHITSRAEDIRQFVECAEGTLEDKSIVEGYNTEILLCETAFGDLSCPVDLVRKLAEKAFRDIEFGSWMPQRERLLYQVLNGLRATKVKELVKSKLRSWFPCRTGRRQGIFDAMISWPRTPEVVECLVRGIHDEGVNNQRAAARVLAGLMSGDIDTGERICLLAKHCADPKIRAAAIEGLLRGWPSNEKIKAILEEARCSISPELRLVSIIGRIQLQDQTKADQRELLSLGSFGAGLDYDWKGEVSGALLAGWPKSQETKKTCLEVLQRVMPSRNQLDSDLALRILLKGYPQDEDVAQFCVDQITNPRYPFSSAHAIPWHLLSQNFRGHPEIVKAIDSWIPQQKHEVPEISTAAMVGRTQVAKAKLIELLDSPVPHWAARSLLEGWGMQDSEVAKILSEITYGLVDKASKIGFLLPNIIDDKDKSRARLLDLLRDPNCKRPDFVMMGLKELSSTNKDTEIVDIALKVILQNKNLWFGHRNSVIKQLIEDYSLEPRVKELAEQQLLEREGPYAAIASTYGENEEIRKRIIDIACPLPVNLRRIIATRLGEIGYDETFSLSFLQSYDLEENAEVKTQASISYYSLLRASGLETGPAVEFLSQDIVCYGPDYEQRRQAAFCGLVSLGRLDIMIDTKEKWGEPEPCAISAAVSALHPNPPLLKHIMQNWDYIRDALSDDFLRRLSMHESDPLAVWDAFSMLAEDYPSAREYVLRFLEDREERTARANLLAFLARLRPRSQVLLEYCLECYFTEHSYFGEALVAAEIIGSHFGGIDEVLSRVLSEKEFFRNRDRLVIALCEGWPESPELQRVFHEYKGRKVPMSRAAFYRLLFLKSPADHIYKYLLKKLSSPDRYALYDSEDLVHPLSRRLRSDEGLCSMLLKRLRENPTPSEKATIPGLISSARGLSHELTSWCIEEIDRQIRRREYPEIGCDLISGEIRAVADSLLDLLFQETQTVKTSRFTETKEG